MWATHPTNPDRLTVTHSLTSKQVSKPASQPVDKVDSMVTRNGVVRLDPRTGCP